MPSLVIVVQSAAVITSAILVLVAVIGYAQCRVLESERLNRSR